MHHLNSWFARLVGPWRRRALAVLGALLAFGLLQFGAARLTQAQQGGADFDHASTGFALNGQHQNVRCETCHTKGTFKGTPKDCASCHGWNNPRAQFSFMPRNHIPTGNASCESCHSPTQAQFADAALNFSHVNVVSLTCVNCHSSRNPHPGVKTNPTDATHQAVLAQGQSCDKCHTTAQFTGPKIPVNHIPTAAVACTNCHTNSDFAVMPAIADIHVNAPSRSSNCQQCHSAASAAAFALPGMVPPLVGPPTNHIDMGSASCETCHVGASSSLQLPVQNGARFSNSAFNHNGTSAGCASCHAANGVSVSFFGISNIVPMPPSTGSGPSIHIPTSAACESCHRQAPAGQLPANAMRAPPGTGFQLPAPTRTDLHANVNVSCSTCHEVGVSWLGVDVYPRTALFTPGSTAPYIGFQTRPYTGGSGYSLSDPLHPATGECSNCHSVAAGFGAPVKPNNHIPTSAGCALCHKNADFSVMPGLTDIHANAQPGTRCAQCHANAGTYPMTPAIVAPPTGHIAMGSLGCEGCHVGSGSSMPSTTVVDGASFGNSAFSHSGIASGCASCHGASAGAFYGVVPRNISSLSPAHLPVSAAATCESCHTASNPGATLIPLSGASGGMTTFAGAGFLHSGTSATCATCHGQNVSGSSFAGNPNIIAMPQSGVPGSSAHVPTAAACESCHRLAPTGLLPGSSSKSVPGSDFSLPPLPTTSDLHNNVSVACSACHEAGMSWVGVRLYPRTTAYTPGAATPYIGFQTRPNLSSGAYSLPDGTHPGVGECSNCHSVAAGFAAPTKAANHIPTSAACGACHTSPDFSVMPGTADIHANAQAGVPCAQCHSDASRYPMTPPIVVPPGNHIAQGTLGCEACHVGAGSSIAATPVPDGAHFSGALFNHTTFTTGCASCHGANVSGSSFYGVLPVAISGLVPPHMPAPATCETCHGTPGGLVPSAGKSFAGAAFTHSGISSGCEGCHGPNVVSGSFAGNPNIVVMPQSAAFGATAHIPSATNCESCHLGSVPAGVVPFNASPPPVGSTGFKNSPPNSAKIHANSDTSRCSACHEGNMTWVGVNLYPRTPSTYNAGTVYTGFQTRPATPGDIYSVTAGTSHPGLGLDCAQCHTSFSGFGPLPLPTGHIPVSAAGAAGCGNCHGNFSTPPTDVVAIHAYAPSQTTNCVQCHSTDNAALYKTTIPIVTPPADHVPMGSASCEVCHVGSQSSIRGGTVQTGDHFSNALFNHTGISTGCTACHGVTVDASTFTGLSNIVAMSYTSTPPHMRVPPTVGCESCHLNSIPVGQVGFATAGKKTFAGASFSHSGITTNCESCHGPTITPASFQGNPAIVVMPSAAAPGAASHIPSTTTCESCHIGATPAALVAGTASKTTGPGTGFRTPAPSSAVIHSNSNTSACNTCHEKAASWISMDIYPGAPTGARVPGATYTGFQTRPFSGGTGTSVNDATHTQGGDCSNCHVGFTGFGPPSMGNGHIPVSAAGAASCGLCHTDPGGNYGVMPALSKIHLYAPTPGGNCAQCHSSTNAAKYPMTPALKAPAATHIPMAALGCESCHIGSTKLPTTAVSDTADFSGSLYSHSGVSAGCNVCHGPAVTATTFDGTLNIVVMPPTSGPAASTAHLPTSTTCETCHLGSTPSTLLSAVSNKTAATSSFGTPVPTAAMNHTGVTTACSVCHEAGGSSTSDVWMNMAPYAITTAAPFKGFQVRPTASAGVFRVADAAHPTAGDCSACHTSFTDFSSTVKPANHIPTATTASCQSCHATSNYSQMPTLTAIHANAPSTSTNCAQCHSAANAATYNQLPGMNNLLVSPNTTHVPMGTLGCENCHVGANSSIASLPVLSGARFTNSAYSHSGVTSGCFTCHGDLSTTRSFVGQTQTLTPRPMPANHVPNAGNVGCEACHTTVPAGLIAFSGGVGAANTFATTKYSHSGITANCDTCHGVTTGFAGIGNLVVLPSTSPAGANKHIPASNNANCEVCHLGSTPSGLVTVSTGAPKALGTTGFLSPLPTGAMIHSAATGGCAACHENNYAWLGVNLYPRSPTTYQAGATYVGFQTRPVTSGAGTYSITDPNNHPAAGDCSLCHGSTVNFSAVAKPANHIPTSATAQCQNCHTDLVLSNGVYVSSSINFVQSMTLANIHAYAPSTTSNCAQCHSSANAATYAISSIPFTIKSPTGINHVAFGSTACEVCHVYSGGPLTTPVSNPAATFAGGKYSHTGVTSGCAACHGNGLSATNFTGISNLVAIPATATQGATAHIPYSAACEVCHAGSIPGGLLAVSGSPASPSGFRLPAPTGSMIHNGISTGCSACHDSNFVWKGVDLYPINPSTVTANASYKGFQTRPLAAPVSTTLGRFGITDSAHPASGDCSQCHANTTAFTGVDKPAGHMPTTTPACSTCHSPTDYSKTGLASMTALHTGLVYNTTVKPATTASMAAKLCANCHAAGAGGTTGSAPFTGCQTATDPACATAPALNNFQPSTTDLHPVHVPIGSTAAKTLDCNACHINVSAFSGLNMKNDTMHTSVYSVAGVPCMGCHERGLSFYGVSNLKVRPSGHHTGQDCGNSGCHTYTGGFRALVKPVMRAAQVAPDMARIRPIPQTNKPSRGSLGNSFDHKGVASGQCKTCHDGKSASGMPARHLMVATSCDTCHRPTTWLPAQFSHNGITPNTCLVCHNGMNASGKPAGHFMSARSCDSCHKTVAWTPVGYQHLSPLYVPSPDKLSCISCHDTNGEIIRRQARALTRTKPIPLGQ